MKIIKIIILMLCTSLTLNAEGYYILTDVKSYDPIVIIDGKELEVFSAEIKLLMEANALELDVNTTGHSSRVLAFVINKFSVADTIGVAVVLELGEYVRRKGSNDEVFAISYMNQRRFTYYKEDLEDDLADMVEEMLETFATQYKDDNKNLSTERTMVTHETFAKDMDYESNYETALAKAKKEGKKLMVFMTTAYCPWCRKLEHRILSQGHIDKKIKATHVPLILNYDEKKFPKNLGKITVVPTLSVVSAKTEKIEETFVGFSSRNMFLNYLKNQDGK